MLLLHFLNLLLQAVLRLKIKGRISGFVNWRENCYIHAQTANRSSMRLSQMTFNNARLNTYVRTRVPPITSKCLDHAPNISKVVV